MSSASKKLLKELPSAKVMNEIISDLRSKGPQATAIMGTAYLEHALELLIKASFRSLPKKEDNDRLFSGGAGGALGPFSSKIRIAYATRLIQQEVYDALLLINDIRNVFAHSLHIVDFNHELVAADCARLRSICPTIASAAGLYDVSVETPIEVFSSFVSILFRSLRYEVEASKEPYFDPYELRYEDEIDDDDSIWDEKRYEARRLEEAEEEKREEERLEEERHWSWRE